MDNITHAALGAACAQAILGQYAKHIPWIAGALGGMAADLDFFLRFNQGALSLEYWHRHFTHSLLFIPVGGLLVALCLLCIPYFRRHWRLTIGASLIGYATHALLDACTSYGTLLFWPWSDARISWDIVSIIDPMVTFPLILGTVWSVINQEKKGVIFSLIFVAFFLRFNAIQHQRALSLVYQFAQQQNLSLNRIRAMPNLASSTSWRIIAKQEGCIFIAEASTPLWSKGALLPIISTPAFSQKKLPFTLSAQQEKELAIFSWFSDNYLIVVNQKPLILADARYTMGYHPLYALWGIQLAPAHPSQRLSYIKIDNKCHKKGAL